MAPRAGRAARDARSGVAERAALSTAALLLALGFSACSADEADPDPTADTDLSVLTATEGPPEASTSPEPLVTGQPDEYSEVGDLVDGFPIDLLPVPGDAVILVTSAVPVGDADVQEVSLNLRTAATAPELLEMYRTTLTGAGFSEVASETADSDLAAQVTFVRSSGDEVVSIGVLDVDGGRTLTIGGRVRTPAEDS